MGAGLKERRLESPSSKAPRSRAPSARRRVTVCVGSSMASTKSHDSAVQDRTVSVLPSRYSRVMEASYVRQNLPMSWERKSISIQGMLMRPEAQEGVGQGRRGKAELVVGFSSQSSSVLPGVTRQAHGDAVSFGTGLGGGGGERGQFVGHPGFHLQMQVMPWHNFLGLAHLPEVNTVMGATHSTVCARRFRVTPRGALAGDTPARSGDGENIQQRGWCFERGDHGSGGMSFGGRAGGRGLGHGQPRTGRGGDGAGGTAEGSRRVSL